jgi:hypothetical protein
LHPAVTREERMGKDFEKEQQGKSTVKKNERLVKKAGC